MMAAVTPKLLLIDGLSIVRRVYEAIPGDESPERVEDAMVSCLSSFSRAVDEHAPTHFLAVFDAPGPTWRHKLFDGYKLARSPMPTLLRVALPSFFEQLHSIGLSTIQVEGVEADDVLATLSARAVKRGFKTILLSTDKDLNRLVDFGVDVYDHFKREWHDEAWIQNKFGVPSKYISELLALAGDASDGIPGVPSVGIKKAAKLLNEFGSFENIFNNLDGIPGKLGQALKDNYDLAKMSRALAALKMDVDIIVTPNSLMLGEIYATRNQGQRAHEKSAVSQPKIRP